MRFCLKGWSKAEGEPQARATEKERQPGVQSYEPICLCGHADRRTETAYKAKFPGELAQHNEAQGSGDMVNAVRLEGTRMLDVVWAEGEKPSATRFGALYSSGKSKTTALWNRNIVIKLLCCFHPKFHRCFDVG